MIKNWVSYNDSIKNIILAKASFIMILSAAMYYFSTEYWIFSWLAPIPLCIYALEENVISTVCVGFIAYLVGSSNPSAVLPMPIYFSTKIADGLAFAIVLSLFRYATIRTKHWSTSFIFASGWTSYEWLTTLYSPHGTAASVAYSQTANLPIIQIASVTGSLAITLLLLLIPASLSVAWHNRRKQKMSNKAMMIPLSLLLLITMFGYWRLNVPQSSSSIKVGITAIPINMEQYLSVVKNSDTAQVLRTVTSYSQNIDTLAQMGANVILLPEKIATLNGQHDILEPIKEKASKNKVVVIGGVINHTDEKYYNSAYLISEEGETLLKYDKQHLLPAFEGKYTSGNTLASIETKAMGKWGIEICKDMDFMEPALQYSRQGTNIIFVPALDFHDDGWSHGRIAIMRGVEGNYAVARAGQWGLLTLSDSRGRIIAEVTTDGEQDGAFLIGEVKLGAGTSIYSSIGNWFGRICLGGFIIQLIFLLGYQQSQNRKN